MRVFLDTNVLVSAFVSRGLCADLVKLVLERHDLLISDLVMKELESVLIDKLQAPKPLAERALGILRVAEMVPGPARTGGEFGLDADDDAIVGAAIESRADLFVTGDRAILAAADRVPVPVLSPRGFMALHRSRSDSYPHAEEGDDKSRVSESVAETTHEAASAFALSIVDLCRTLEARGLTALATELLRAGAGVAAALDGIDLASPQRPVSRPAFCAMGQARVAEHWLRLLAASAADDGLDIARAAEQCEHLVRLLGGASTVDSG